MSRTAKDTLDYRMRKRGLEFWTIKQLSPRGSGGIGDSESFATEREMVDHYMGRNADTIARIEVATAYDGDGNTPLDRETWRALYIERK